jgi:putative cardiolipin synthase
MSTDNLPPHLQILQTPHWAIRLKLISPNIPGREGVQASKNYARKEKKGSTGSSKASLHAKFFVIDRKRIFISSMNLDPRSVVENTEIGKVIDSIDMAVEMSEWFDQNIDQIAFRLALEKDNNGDEILVW